MSREEIIQKQQAIEDEILAIQRKIVQAVRDSSADLKQENQCRDIHASLQTQASIMPY